MQVWFPLIIIHSPLSSRHTMARRSASGSVATTRSALSRVPSLMPSVMASGFSGLGLTTVGKFPSMTICSGTTWMFWKPHERRHKGTMTRPVPCMGVYTMLRSFCLRMTSWSIIAVCTACM